MIFQLAQAIEAEVPVAASTGTRRTAPALLLYWTTSHICGDAASLRWVGGRRAACALLT